MTDIDGLNLRWTVVVVAKKDLELPEDFAVIMNIDWGGLCDFIEMTSNSIPITMARRNSITEDEHPRFSFARDEFGFGIPVVVIQPIPSKNICRKRP